MQIVFVNVDTISDRLKPIVTLLTLEKFVL